MALLPEGFALPPLPYLVALCLALAAVGGLLIRRRPPVTERTVLAFVPWMVVGAALHVLHVVGALPAAVRPLTGTPAVYLTVAVVGGATWLVADVGGDERLVAGVGGVCLSLAVAAALGVGAARGTLRLAPAVGILVVAGVVGWVTWGLLRRTRPDVAVTGRLGELAVLAHALDGVSTAVGVDLLGFGERSPLSRLVIEFAGTLPVADAVGQGWLFVLVKLAVAVAIVVALVGSVREEPVEGRLLLGFVAAVGLGPGAHNVLLFVIST
jgi:uncharacterized membrane protein